MYVLTMYILAMYVPTAHALPSRLDQNALHWIGLVNAVVLATVVYPPNCAKIDASWG